MHSVKKALKFAAKSNQVSIHGSTAVFPADKRTYVISYKMANDRRKLLCGNTGILAANLHIITDMTRVPTGLPQMVCRLPTYGHALRDGPEL